MLRSVRRPKKYASRANKVLLDVFLEKEKPAAVVERIIEQPIVQEKTTIKVVRTANGNKGDKGDRGHRGLPGPLPEAGKDAAFITNISVEKRDVLIEMSDGVLYVLKNIKAQDVQDGQDGISINRIYINDSGNLVTEYSDGRIVTHAKVVADPPQQPELPREPTDVKNLYINEKNLVVCYSDGRKRDLGRVVGKTFIKQGPKGDRGFSVNNARVVDGKVVFSLDNGRELSPIDIPVHAVVANAAAQSIELDPIKKQIRAKINNTWTKWFKLGGGGGSSQVEIVIWIRHQKCIAPFSNDNVSATNTIIKFIFIISISSIIRWRHLNVDNCNLVT